MIAIMMTQAVNTTRSRRLHHPVTKMRRDRLTLNGLPLTMSKRAYRQNMIIQKKKRTSWTLNLRMSQKVVIRVAAVAAIPHHLS